MHSTHSHGAVHPAAQSWVIWLEGFWGAADNERRELHEVGASHVPEQLYRDNLWDASGGQPENIGMGAWPCKASERVTGKPFP